MREIWPKFHIQILATRPILSVFNVNEEGLKLGPRVEVTTLKVKNKLLFHSLIFLFSLCFNFNSSLTPRKLFCMAFVYVYIVINFYDIYHFKKYRFIYCGVISFKL